MAQERPLTPEKQLLGLIEGNKAKNAAVQASAIRHYGLSLFSHGAWIGRISFFKDRFKGWFKAGGPYLFDVKTLNNLLALILFVLAVYFIGNLFVSVINLNKKPDYLKSAIKGGEMTTADIGETLGLNKAASYYLEKVRQRDIFKMGAKGAVPAVKAPTPRIVEATQHLKLVGISWSNDPDALIEDARALRTFFVKRSQMIGEVKVQAIFKDKVILSYGGEEIELK